MREIHLKAPRGWINDPNGFIYFGGEYHLFYQHFPYAPRWGRMHWGHAVSDDLMNWEHKEIALFPTKTADCDGCFSGSAIEAEGRFLFYRSRDLEHWEYVNFVAKSGTGWMWECPDYFETDGKGIVIFSPMGLPIGNQAICGFADFDEENCTMTLGNDF